MRSRFVMVLLMGLTAFVTAATSHTTNEWDSIEKIPIRVWKKSWGGERFNHCEPDDFGWDSLTFLVSRGETLRTGAQEYDTLFKVQMTVDSVFTPDSIQISWLSRIRRTDRIETYATGGTRPLGTVGRTPITFTTNSFDGGYYFKVGVVRPWPETVRRSRPFVLAGVVVDDETGQPLPNSSIFVHDSRFVALTDADGRFRIEGEHGGDLSIVVCRYDYLDREIEVGSGARSMKIRLRR